MVALGVMLLNFVRTRAVNPSVDALFVNRHFCDEAMLAFVYLLLRLPFGDGVCSAR
jgi:hypothetical protein